MSATPKYSVVVPIYNRPEELEELLVSLTEQTYKQFEVLIVEDGSTKTSQAVFEKFSSKLSIQYFFKPNSGPGPSRNFGFERARGEYFVVFDSDCILPPDYFNAVEISLSQTPLDAWGGPDRGHPKFTPVQRAMAYTMSSFLTTGGIRGGKSQAATFQPRSFNMGISRRVFEKTKGFAFDREAEDIELSIRMKKEGFHLGLIPDAFVYHKRRTNFRQFFFQVKGFGRGRVKVGRAHPGEVKITHWFPVLFLFALVIIPVVLLFNYQLGLTALLCLATYLAAVFVDAIRKTGSLFVAMLSLPGVVIQLTGYAIGFLKEWRR